MSELTGKFPKNTYKDLLKLGTAVDNAGLTSTLVRIQDGLGNNTPISISTTVVNFNNTRLQGVGTPTATTDATTKAYVDSLVGSAAAGGTNTQIQYNLNDALAGDTGFTTNGSGSINITGDLDVDNININGNTISSTNTNGNITISPNGTGVVDVSTSYITNVIDPTNAQDAATKNYVDNISGIKYFKANSTGTAATATGTDAIAIGENAIASGAESVAIGAFADAEGAGSVAIGGSAVDAESADSTADYAIAIGFDTLVSAARGVAIGPYSEVVSAEGVAIGAYADASGVSSIAIGGANSDGNSADATADYAIAIGINSLASGINAVAIGANIEATATNNVRIGTHATNWINLSANGDLTFGTAGASIQVDNININGNIISSTNTNGNIILDPNGTGLVVATSGYDMSSGPGYAFATKDYVDNRPGTSMSTTNNATTTIFTYSAAAYESTWVDYCFKRDGGLGVTTGSVQLATDGTAVQITDTRTTLGNPGDTITATISSGTVSFKVTLDNQSQAGTFKYVVRRLGI